MLRKKNLIVLATLLLFVLGALHARGEFSSAKIYNNNGVYDKALDSFLKYIEKEDDIADEDYIESLYTVAEYYFFGKVPSQDSTKIDLYEKAYEYYTKCVSTLQQIEGKVNLEKEEVGIQLRDENGKKHEMTFMEVKNDSELKISACIVRIYNIALENYNIDEYGKAAEAIRRLLVIDPEYANADLLLYNIALKQNDREKAAEHIVSAARKAPDRIELKDTAASNLFNLKRYQDAAGLYQEMMAAQPDSVSHVFNLAICYVNMKKDTLAYESFQKVLELEPDNTDALVSASNYAMNFNDPEKRVLFLTRLADLQPENDQYLMSLCYLLNNQKMYDKVLEYAGKWHELKPDEKQPVQLLHWAAKELKKADLVKKYEDMLKKMQ